MDFSLQVWWETWWSVFLERTSARTRLAVPLALPAGRLEAVRALAGARLGPAEFERDHARVRGALAQEQSAFERRVERSHAERTGGDAYDPEATLFLIVLRERARVPWLELERLLAPDERLTLVEWGVRTARASHRSFRPR